MAAIIAEAVIPYAVLLFNSLFFYLVRLPVNQLSPQQFRLLLNEVISTVELCADCAELGVVWEFHGNLGLSVALFLLCLWWTYVFGEAEACPCGPIEECLVLGRSLTSEDILHKLIGQLIGAYLTWKYTNSVIWSWHMSEQHQHLHTDQCQATLFVSPLYGATIEGLITFISRLVALESDRWSHNLSLLVNSITTVLLVLFALNTTGGYFNPIMASALTFNCEGNSMSEHLIVYWVGAILGGLVARWCHHQFLSGGLSLENHDKSE